jgi:hypothetical protein
MEKERDVTDVSSEALDVHGATRREFTDHAVVTGV